MGTSYFSSQIVRNGIEDSPLTFQTPWPPTAANLNVNCTRQFVPHELFNCIAWTTGVSEDTNANGYVSVRDNEENINIVDCTIYHVCQGKRQNSYP